MNPDILNQEEQPNFWKRTLIGIPYWLIALILILLIIYWIYKQGHLTSLGIQESPKGSYSLNKAYTNVPTITPASQIALPVR